MFAIERRQKIIDIIAETNSITVSELSRRLGVTVVTIRKDLEVLENNGLVTRTYGGVILGRHPRQSEPLEKDVPPTFPQAVIEAAKLIAPGQTVLMGRGRMVVELADFIKNYENLTIITISLEVAMKLSKAPGLDVILTGGILRPRTLTMLGHLAERVIKEVAFDLSFAEVDGVHHSVGITTSNMVEAATEAVLLEASVHPVIFAEAQALGRIASTTIARLRSNMTILVTGNPDGTVVEALRKRGAHVIIAGNHSPVGGAGDVD